MVKLKRIIIAAVSGNGVIGKNNSIPWDSLEELEFFKKATIGFPVIMGRTTYESIGKTLPGRLNLVISSSASKKTSNPLYFKSVKDCYNYLRKNNFTKVYICGGGRIYRNTIKHADVMIISFMKFNVEGDTKFPKINLRIWKITKQVEHNDFTVKYFERIKKS